MILDFLKKAYRNACSEGEAVTYRAQVTVLGDSEALKHDFIKRLLGDPRYSYKGYVTTKGVKTRKITSKFNKVTKKTERWSVSASASRDLMRDIRNAVLSHIISVQQGGQAKGEKEILQQSYFSSADSRGKESSVSTYESNKTGKQGVRQNIADKLHTNEKEFAVQFQNPDNETLFFLHRKAQIKETLDNNIPYSLNLWNFDSQDKFSAVNHSFLKAEALILYVVDTNVNLFSPFQRSRGEKDTNENPKTPLELLRYWLNSVHIQASKQNLKPNIVLLLLYTGSPIQSQYIESYIKTIIDMVKGKPYAPYISKENIILINIHRDSFEDIIGELFDRIKMLPSWGVKESIRWLYLEADLLRRTRAKKSYMHRYELEELAFSDIANDDDDHCEIFYDDDAEPCLLVSKVKQLALAYNMDDYEVDSFIEFHQTLGDLICCTLSNGERCIITNPQWLMDRFGELVSTLLHWYRLGISQRSEGIVSYNDLQSIWYRFDVQLLTDILISFGFILPLDNQKGKYLVHCMLHPKDNFLPETELTYSAICNPNVDDILSFGTYHRLLSSCAQESNWKLSHLLHSDPSFEVTNGTHLVLTQMKNNTVQVSAWTSKQELKKAQVSNDEISAILFEIHKDISRKMEVLGMKQSKSFRMLCPHWRPGDEYVCLVEIEEKPDPRPANFLFYPKSEKCAIHNKALGPHLFNMTGEHWKGI